MLADLDTAHPLPLSTNEEADRRALFRNFGPGLDGGVCVRAALAEWKSAEIGSPGELPRTENRLLTVACDSHPAILLCAVVMLAAASNSRAPLNCFRVH